MFWSICFSKLKWHLLDSSGVLITIQCMDQQTFQTQVLAFMAEMREFKSEMLEFKRSSQERFTHIDERFDTLHKDVYELKQDVQGLKADIHHLSRRIDHLDDGVNTLQSQNIELRGKIDEIYQSRNTVKIRFGWQWAVASFLIAVTASSCSLFLGKVIEI